MEAKLKENYPNDFLTTMLGLVFRKDSWTTFTSHDIEVRNLLEQPNILELKDKKLSENTIINDDVTKKTIKEVITPVIFKENKEVLKEALEEEENHDGTDNKEPANKED